MSEINHHISERDFITENNQVIPAPEFAYQSWGTLNTTRDNVVLVCHALTGNSDAADWFPGLFREDSPVDPERHYILCINHLGSCYGSTGPWSVNPVTSQPYRTDFPDLTIRDLANFQIHLLDELGITEIELVIGGSMGGMVALELSLLDKRIKSACLMAMGKSHSAWAIGISAAQRQAIYADKYWNEGRYSKENPPSGGLAAARAMAMITYRSAENYEQKFSRSVNDLKDQFEVESYLDYQGSKLVQRFDALSYVCLTKVMDSHDVSRKRGSFEQALQQLQIPILILGINSDLLYPTKEQKELARLIPGGQYAEISSPFGHDAFLIEFDQINHHLSGFLQNQLRHQTILNP